MLKLAVTKTCAEDCDECGKLLQGVRFELAEEFGKRVGNAFLCWEHFRLTANTLVNAGVLAPKRMKTVIETRCNYCRVGCCCHHSHSYTRSGMTETSSRGQTICRSEGESVGTSRSESVGSSRTIGMGCSNTDTHT